MVILEISLPTILARLHSARELGIIAAIAVVVIAFMTLKEKWRKYRTRSWPTAVGAIENLRAEKVDGGLNGVDYWRVNFDYRYSVGQEHSGRYHFNCTSENMSIGAVAGLRDKTVCVHYKPSDESKSLLWEDEIWDLWWGTYWRMGQSTSEEPAG